MAPTAPWSTAIAAAGPVLRWVHRDGGNTSWAEPEVTTWEGGAGTDHTRAVGAFVRAVAAQAR